MSTQKFNSVWDALGDTASESASMKARSELMIAIRAHVEKLGLTQVKASKKLGITQPRLNDLIRGRINRFSLDALFDLSARAGIKVNLTLKAA